MPSSKQVYTEVNTKKHKSKKKEKSLLRKNSPLSSSVPNSIEEYEMGDSGSMSNIYVLTQMITEESLERQVAEKELGRIL